MEKGVAIQMGEVWLINSLHLANEQTGHLRKWDKQTSSVLFEVGHEPLSNDVFCFELSHSSKPINNWNESHESKPSWTYRSLSFLRCRFKSPSFTQFYLSKHPCLSTVEQHTYPRGRTHWPTMLVSRGDPACSGSCDRGLNIAMRPCCAAIELASQKQYSFSHFSLLVSEHRAAVPPTEKKMKPAKDPPPLRVWCINAQKTRMFDNVLHVFWTKNLRNFQSWKWLYSLFFDANTVSAIIGFPNLMFIAHKDTISWRF